MARSTKDAWLTGPSDIQEADVEDVPVPGQSIRVRGLPAAYSNRAHSQAIEMVTGPRGEQTGRVNVDRMEILQFAYGCVEPSFSEQEAEVIAKRFGPAFKKVIAKIDELSAVDKEAITQAEAVFPGGGAGADGPDVGVANGAGSDRSDLPVRAGA